MNHAPGRPGPARDERAEVSTGGKAGPRIAPAHVPAASASAKHYGYLTWLRTRSENLGTIRLSPLSNSLMLRGGRLRAVA